MIIEGSTLGRLDQTQKNENDMVEEMAQVFSEEKLGLITFSVQNLERFVTVYKVCLKNKKTLVLDPYSCYILEKFKHLSNKLPQFDSNNIRIYFVKNSITKKLAEREILFKYKSKKISIKEIQNEPEKYVIKDNYHFTKKLLEKFELNKIQYVYSLWNGYLENPKDVHIYP